MVIFLKLVVLMVALIATVFGIMLLFFYEQFKVSNDLVNNQYIFRDNRYGNGSGYSFDKFVFGWHTIFAIILLLTAAWLFSVFFRYLFL